MIVMMIWFANAILNNLLDQQFTLGLFLIFRFNSMQIEPLLSSKLIASVNAILSSQLSNFATNLGFLTEAKDLTQKANLGEWGKKYPKKTFILKIVWKLSASVKLINCELLGRLNMTWSGGEEKAYILKASSQSSQKIANYFVFSSKK